MEYHKPVLLEEAVNGLQVNGQGIYVDLTFGGGGHAFEILKRITTGRLVAFDQDPDAMVNELADERFLFIASNFRYLKNSLKYHNITQVDGILADLGISSHQIDSPERGFSIRFDSALDMRMHKSGKKSAASVINEYDEQQLAQVFKNYGDIPNARQLAKHIVKTRTETPIQSTEQLKAVAAPFFRKEKEAQEMARLFQSIRIEVNDEMGALKDLLEQSSEVLAPGGRLVVISYHSLEDRLVKNYIRTGNVEGNLQKDFYGNVKGRKYVAINKKPIVPGAAEIKLNPRARSAKMRIAEKMQA